MVVLTFRRAWISVCTCSVRSLQAGADGERLSTLEYANASLTPPGSNCSGIAAGPDQQGQ